MSKLITIEELLDSKGYVKNNITFGTPDKMIGHMIEILRGIDPNFEVRVERETTNTNEDESVNISYGRVLIEAVPAVQPNDHGIVPKLGLLYALDTSKPVMKVYTGCKVSACLNLCVFNSESLVTVDLNVKDSMVKIEQALNDYVNNIEKNYKEVIEQITELKNRIVPVEELPEIIGNIAIAVFSEHAMGVQTFTYAMEQMYNVNSKYYIGSGTTAWNMFNALTQHITDKISFADAPDKTLGIVEVVKIIFLKKGGEYGSNESTTEVS